MFERVKAEITSALPVETAAADKKAVVVLMSMVQMVISISGECCFIFTCGASLTALLCYKVPFNFIIMVVMTEA